MPNQILFLCTGNYYRSRFAEHLFNAMAVSHKLDWRASSRALALELGGRNPGPISPHALEALATRGVALERPIRFPRSLHENDLRQAAHVVALKEAEHRAMLDRRFPAWTERVEFWHIDDVDVAEPRHALAQLEQTLVALIQRFSP